MPTRTPTITQPDAERLPGNWSVIQWTGMLNGDDGAPIDMVAYPDRSVQVTGVFGAGGNLRLEGTIDGTNWAPLTDPQGNALDVTAAKIEAISELVRQVRPRVTAGDGTTSLVVTMLVRGGLR
jgi:hypothetical protein